MTYETASRKQDDILKTVSSGYISFCDFVTSVSERHFLLCDETISRQLIEYKKQDEIDKLGGLSGCPAFISRNGHDDLAGFVYESSDGITATIFIAHADFIKQDGTIDQSKIPFA